MWTIGFETSEVDPAIWRVGQKGLDSHSDTGESVIWLKPQNAGVALLEIRSEAHKLRDIAVPRDLIEACILKKMVSCGFRHQFSHL
jgi:hypothetical protein